MARIRPTLLALCILFAVTAAPGVARADEGVVDAAAPTDEAATDEGSSPVLEPASAPLDTDAVDPSVPVETLVELDETWTAGPGSVQPAPSDPDYENVPPPGDALSMTNAGDWVVGYGFGPNLDETWIYDGATHAWADASAATNPGARALTATAPPPDGGSGHRVLLAGGFDPSTGFYDDTWIYDGGDTWTQACGTGVPGNPCNSGVRVASAATGNNAYTFLFGGVTVVGPEFVTTNDLFLWDPNFATGPNWVPAPLLPGPAPDPRFVSQFEWDGDAFVLFGGLLGAFDNETPVNDTWLLKQAGGSWYWEQVCTICPPAPRAAAAFAYHYDPDPALEGVLMIGGAVPGPGADETTHLSDAWFWNGQAWELLRAGPTTTALTQAGIPYVPLAAGLPAYGKVLFTATYWDPEIGDHVRLTFEDDLVLAPAVAAEPEEAVEVVVVEAALPFTGRHTADLLGPAFGLLVVGTVLVGTTILGRRRETRAG